MNDKNIIISLGFILVIMLTGMYFHGENNYNQGLEDGYNEAKQNLPNISWKHFATVGENISMYIDGREFVSINKTGTFSYWMQCVGESGSVHTGEIAFWNRTDIINRPEVNEDYLNTNSWNFIDYLGDNKILINGNIIDLNSEDHALK